MTPEPTLKAALKAKWAAMHTPGDPFNQVLDDLAAYAEASPQAFVNLDADEITRRYLALIADRMKETLADRLRRPKLKDRQTLRVSVVNDWQINAAVFSEPPYDVEISWNLWRYFASVSDLLVSGIGIDVTDDAGVSEARVRAPRTVAAVARDLRRVLDSFLADQTVPLVEGGTSASHFSFQHIVFFSSMAFVVGHEFGHVVIAETKNAGQPVPFEPFAEHALAANFGNILKDPRHDRGGRVGLARMNAQETAKVRARWLNEINADILGASLACEYMRDHGPYKGKPNIIGMTKLSIHLCTLAQMFLTAYTQFLRQDIPSVSKTHPPIDFRTHCVLSWMYKEQMQEATEHVVKYVQQVMKEMLQPAAQR